MTGPTAIEKKHVNNIKDIRDYRGRSWVGVVKTVTEALGLDDEFRARLLRYQLEKSNQLFAGKLPFTGAMLVHFCEELYLKPETFLQQRHFDQAQTPRFDNEMWHGPPAFLLTGDQELGEALELVANHCGLRRLFHKSRLDGPTFESMVAGERPIPLDLLRDFVSDLGDVDSVAETYSDETVTEAYKKLLAGIALVPAGVKTARQLSLPPLTRTVSEAERAAYESRYNTKGNGLLKNGTQSLVRTTTPADKKSESPPTANTQIQERTPMNNYETLFVSEAIGAVIVRLTAKSGKKNVHLHLGGRRASADELEAIKSGALLVAKKDLEGYLGDVDAKANMGQADEVTYLDVFLQKVKGANGSSHEDGSIPAPEGVTSDGTDVDKEVSSAADINGVGVPSDEVAVIDKVPAIVWGEQSVTIGGKVIDLTSGKGKGRSTVYEVLQTLRGQRELSWKKLADKAGAPSPTTFTNFNQGSSAIDQAKAEAWSKALGITVPQLFGVDPLEPLPATEEGGGQGEVIEPGPEAEVPAESSDTPPEPSPEAVSAEAALSAPIVLPAESPAPAADILIVTEDNSADDQEARTWLIDRLVEDIKREPGPEATEAWLQALGYLETLARGSQVDVNQVYPGWRQAQIARQALDVLRRMDLGEYHRLMLELNPGP